MNIKGELLGENQQEVGGRKKRVGENIFEICCMCIWKEHNETYLKNLSHI
jgi:hypothetical protein